MEFSADIITQFMGDMLLPFMRISGMLATMIGLSAKTVPTTVRALLTLFITLIIIPVIPPVPVEEVFSVSTFVLVIQQLIIGISLGFISSMVLDTFVLAGQVVALQTGLGFASIVDPVNGISVPAVGQFYLILIVNLAFGVMTKAAPQLNIFSLGFTIAQITGLVIIWITMDNFTYHFELQWDRAQQMMCQLVNVCP